MFKEIVEKISSMNIYKERRSTEECYEIVFYNKDIASWEKIISDYLGPAKKPAGVFPSDDDLSITKGYGRILANQTLFQKKTDDETIIAMFWPWGDPEYCTLIIAKTS